MPSAPPPLRDRWFGCLLWQGSVNSSGYGTDWSSGRPRLAHYVAFELERGQVGEGLVLDHLCRRRRCVAVPHLEAVTPAENTRRRAWAYRARRQTCLSGHQLFTEGRRTPEGGIVCRVCSGVGERRA